MFKKNQEKQPTSTIEEEYYPKNLIDRFKYFIKTEWKFLLFLFLFYLAMTWELPYAIYTPGGAINMSERIEGDNTYDEKGSLSMTYVSMVRGTIPFLALSYIVPNWDIAATEDLTYDNVDFDETVEIDKLYMKEAISNAEYVAYKAAGIDFKEENIHNLVTQVSKDAKTKLRYGDEILSVDGMKYTSLKEFQDYIATKKIGDKVKLEYIKDGKTESEEVELIDVEGQPKVGIGIATVSDYTTEFNIEVKTKASESGPSGGFITALAIYNSITKEDLTHGKTIMGTGTIDKDGKVGVIGGVKYKLLGAYKKGADVFICPKENYEEAKQVKEDEDMDIILLSAETFEEGLEKLSQIK